MTASTIASATLNLSNVIDQWLVYEDKSFSAPLMIDDPIAAACASYRFGKETGIRWTRLSDAKITDHDRTAAQELKNYYIGKLTVQALKGQPLTEFRKKLYGILVDHSVVTEGDQGLIQRLPYFYDEDLAVADVVANTVPVPTKTLMLEKVVTLTPYKKIFQGRKHGEYTQFWWRDEQNHGVMLKLKTDNVLYSLIDSMFTKPTQFVAKYSIGTHYWENKEHGYYKLLQPRIA